MKTQNLFLALLALVMAAAMKLPAQIGTAQPVSPSGTNTQPAWKAPASDLPDFGTNTDASERASNRQPLPSRMVSAQSTTREIYDQNKSAVVLLLAYDSSGMPSCIGSGFYFETNKIATNFHVVEGASRIAFRVIGSEDMHEVKRVASVSKALDLAILEVEQEHRPVKIASIEKVGVGDKVVAIGNPRGLEGSVSEGIVSAIRGSEDVKILQITAPISPGSSGGPLFSQMGEVIGVTTATLTDSQSLNFAVPSALLFTLQDKGQNWEPVVAKGMPAPETGNAGVQIVAPHLDYIHYLNFSLLNNNKRAIRNIAYLLIFREDGRKSPVLNFVSCTEEDIIPPGLAKRFSHASGLDSDLPYYNIKVELKVLTYDFVGDNGDQDVLDMLQK
jgi:S1-C subfamily serine protease